jgi:hypothetical protein
MEKRLSYFAYNERCEPGWTLSTHQSDHLVRPFSSISKTVTYVPGTFVTLVSGLNTLWQRGRAEGPGDFCL